jgi:hypothetical protein
MTVSVGCVLFNLEAGGWTDGHFDFEPLKAELAEGPRTPALVKICEGKYWAERGGKGLLLAAKPISDQFGVPYIGLLGYLERGPIPPAIFYNPLVLTHVPPWHGHGSHHEFQDQRNIAHFHVNGVPGPNGDDLEIIAGVDHWEPLHGPTRELAARRWGRHGRNAKLPVVLSADANCTPSGPHFPQRDWDYAAERDWTNASHKGYQQDGTWAPDTAPMDYLIGRWHDGRRVGGAGLALLAERAWQAHVGQPAALRPGLLSSDGRILATVNDKVDAGGGLHIDAVLANDLMMPHFDPASLHIHVPPPGVRRSDHRMLTWELHF